LLSLVRHGAVANPHHLRYGRLPGFVLSDEGRAQAQAAGAYLARSSIGVGRLVSSPLERAVETASLLGEQLPSSPDVELDPRLIELGSRLDGLPRRFAPRAYLARLLDRSSRALDEPVAAAAGRVVAAALERVKEGNGRVILVSHQVPLWAATALLLGGPRALSGFAPRSMMLRSRSGPAPGYAAVLTFAPVDPAGPPPGPGGWRLVDRWAP
jgi:broad specificity phosphatase PhoE